MRRAQGIICMLLMLMGSYSVLQTSEKALLYTVVDETVSKPSSAAAYTVGSLGGSILYKLCDSRLKAEGEKHMSEQDTFYLGFGVTEVSLGLQYLLKKYTHTDNSYLAHAVFPALVALDKALKDSLVQTALYASSSFLIPVCGFLSACAWHAYQTLAKEKKEQTHVQ